MIKRFLKKLIPAKILQLRRDYIAKQETKKFSKMKINEVFEEIYNKKLWSPEEEKNICSIRPKKIKEFEGVLNTKILQL
ncbi:hypothetical protein OAA95_00285 [Pelagibacteraceae bacterium]|nr:hypothetical protein [Pelagibacteraceae bacterium]